MPGIFSQSNPSAIVTWPEFTTSRPIRSVLKRKDEELWLLMCLTKIFFTPRHGFRETNNGVHFLLSKLDVSSLMLCLLQRRRISSIRSSVSLLHHSDIGLVEIRKETLKPPGMSTAFFGILKWAGNELTMSLLYKKRVALNRYQFVVFNLYPSKSLY